MEQRLIGTLAFFSFEDIVIIIKKIQPGGREILFTIINAFLDVVIVVPMLYLQLLPFSVVPYPAVVDNYFLTEHPRTSFQNGRFRGKAFLMSFTADESFGDYRELNY